MKISPKRSLRRRRDEKDLLSVDDISSFMTCARFLQREAEKTRLIKIADIFCGAADKIKTLLDDNGDAGNSPCPPSSPSLPPTL